MIKELKMPVLGLTMESATVLEWVKAEGDQVELDETILVVETDKAATDVPSPAAGILGRIVVPPGEEVPVGAVLAYLVDGQAELISLPERPTQASLATPAPASPPASGPAAAGATAPMTFAAVRQAEAAGARVFASPRARNRARELGVDLSGLAFRGERIIEQDVLEAANAAAPGAGQPTEARLTPLAAKLAAELGISLSDIEASPGLRIRAADLLAAASRAEAAGLVGVSANGGGEPQGPSLGYVTGETRKLNRVRRVTAERMTLAWHTSPQVTYTTRVDMTKAIALRAELKEAAAARGVRLSYDAMFVRAAATALLEFPEANAQWAEGDGIRLSAEAHVGVAVDLAGQGLIVPVIRNAQARGLLEIAREVDRLAALAREGKLGPDDYKGGTFTVSNLGLLGIEAFTPILNLPEAAILGIGAIIPTPGYEGDELVKKELCTLCLTADHRLVDGGPAARVLARIRQLLETPLLLLERGL